jgi:uncharacterized protein YdeI (YjbR/CyaY-like superfamily)
MIKKTTHTNFLHRVPKDLQTVFQSQSLVSTLWNKLTPLARNEWICWVTIVKNNKTRIKHIERLCEDLQKGKKRPCCWPGCPHRRPNTQKYFSKK